MGHCGNRNKKQTTFHKHLRAFFIQNNLKIIAGVIMQYLLLVLVFFGDFDLHDHNN